MTRITKQHAAAKTVALLEALGAAGSDDFPEGVSVGELSRALGRDASVVSRQLYTFVECGLAQINGSGRFELGWRLFALAANAGDHYLVRHAVPLMQRVTANVQERSHLSVLSGAEVLTVRSESSGRLVQASGWVGRTVPVATTSSGIALLMDHTDVSAFTDEEDGSNDSHTSRELLNHIQQARHRGFAVADRIFDPEVIGIAAPVRASEGQIIAALNISGPAMRIEPHISQVAKHVMAAADALTDSLNGLRYRKGRQRV